MTEEQKSDIFFPEQQIARPVRTWKAILKLYAEGHRNFSGSDLRGATITIDSEIEIFDLRDLILKGSNLKAIKIARSYGNNKVDLTSSDLSECNLQGADLSSCILNQCNFNHSDLRSTNLSNSSCRGSDFIETRLSNISVNSDSDFTASDFTRADFKKSQISGTFSHANFSSANFEKASFTSFNAGAADFSNANLQEASFTYSHVQVANFSNASLQNIYFPTPTTVSFQYSYYNSQTKISGDLDPIGRGMELIEDDALTDDREYVEKI